MRKIKNEVKLKKEVLCNTRVKKNKQQELAGRSKLIIKMGGRSR